MLEQAPLENNVSFPVVKLDVGWFTKPKRYYNKLGESNRKNKIVGLPLVRYSSIDE